MFKRLNEVKQVQIGITTRCNSHCKFCFREELLRSSNGDKMDFKDNPIDMPFELYKRIFIDTQLTDIQFCGNKGDAIFHPQFQKILDYTIDKNVFISLSTNGSAFDNSWWEDLGKKMKGEVTFALDGTNHETHSMYRGTNFDKVFNHMKSYIKGGGRARWQFIIFKHNEHQIEEARKIAKDIGCKVFIEVFSRKYDDILQRPSTLSKTKREVNYLFAHAPRIQKILLNQMRCQWCKMSRVYVSSIGKVYPCCYLTCSLHDWYTSKNLFYLKDGFKSNEYNIENYTLNQIIKHYWFRYVYDNINKIPEVCGMHCITWDMYRSKIRKEKEI